MLFTLPVINKFMCILSGTTVVKSVHNNPYRNSINIKVNIYLRSSYISVAESFYRVALDHEKLDACIYN